jgi:hypothetical protein
MLLAEQPVHQRFVRPGPLVLGSTLLKSPTPTADRDRTVSRRSEPRSRTALMGEQPNPWDQLQPQDATIRHRAFFHRYRWRRLYLHPARVIRARGRRLITAIDLTDWSASGSYLTIPLGGMDQSLRGHDGNLYQNSDLTCGDTIDLNRSTLDTAMRMRWYRLSRFSVASMRHCSNSMSSIRIWLPRSNCCVFR